MIVAATIRHIAGATADNLAALNCQFGLDLRLARTF
jgi:hypothetical protein